MTSKRKQAVKKWGMTDILYSHLLFARRLF